jgi:hypothetical protein
LIKFACAPAASEVERRDRTLIAFTLLTGARDGATVSFKLKHLDLVDRTLNQDAREVSTKGAKSFATWFFPVGEDVENIVVEWVRFLIKEKRFGPDDPLFPATKVDLVQHRFTVIGVSRSHWSNACQEVELHLAYRWSASSSWRTRFRTTRRSRRTGRAGSATATCCATSSSAWCGRRWRWAWSRARASPSMPA